MARKQPQTAGETFGRALVDIPAHGLKSGDYATLPDVIAQSLAESGEFDVNAPAPERTAE